MEQPDGWADTDAWLQQPPPATFSSDEQLADLMDLDALPCSSPLTLGYWSPSPAAAPFAAAAPVQVAPAPRRRQPIRIQPGTSSFPARQARTASAAADGARCSIRRQLRQAAGSLGPVGVPAAGTGGIMQQQQQQQIHQVQWQQQQGLQQPLPAWGAGQQTSMQLGLQAPTAWTGLQGNTAPGPAAGPPVAGLVAPASLGRPPGGYTALLNDDTDRLETDGSATKVAAAAAAAFGQQQAAVQPLDRQLSHMQPVLCSRLLEPLQEPLAFINLPFRKRRRPGSQPADGKPPAKRGPAAAAGAAASVTPDADSAAADDATQSCAAGAVCDGAASAAAVGKPRKPKKPKKEAGVPFVEDATNKPQQLGLVSVIKTMLERSAKRREAIELQAQLEKFATTGDASELPKPPQELVQDLASTVEAVLLPLPSKLLLQSEAVTARLQHNPHRQEDNDGHHPGNPGWIQCRPVGQPADKEAEARAAALQAARQQLETARSFKQQISACRDSPAQALQLFQELLSVKASNAWQQLLPEQGGSAAAPSTPAAAAAAAAPAPAPAAGSSHALSDASDASEAAMRGSSSSRGAAAGAAAPSTRRSQRTMRPPNRLADSVVGGMPARGSAGAPLQQGRAAQSGLGALEAGAAAASGPAAARSSGAGADGDDAATAADFDPIIANADGGEDRPFEIKKKDGVLLRVTRQQLQELYHLPVSDAAKELGIGKTAFTDVKNHFGIGRWPYRQQRSINNRSDGTTRWRKPSSAPGSASAKRGSAP